jgi:hypothetical protein
LNCSLISEYDTLTYRTNVFKSLQNMYLNISSNPLLPTWLKLLTISHKICRHDRLTPKLILPNINIPVLTMVRLTLFSFYFLFSFNFLYMLIKFVCDTCKFIIVLLEIGFCRRPSVYFKLWLRPRWNQSNRLHRQREHYIYRT